MGHCERFFQIKNAAWAIPHYSDILQRNLKGGVVESGPITCECGWECMKRIVTWTANGALGGIEHAVKLEGQSGNCVDPRSDQEFADAVEFGLDETDQEEDLE